LLLLRLLELLVWPERLEEGRDGNDCRSNVGGAQTNRVITVPVTAAGTHTMMPHQFMLVTQRASNRMIAGIACLCAHLFIAEPTRQLPKPLGDSGRAALGLRVGCSGEIMWMDHKLLHRHRPGHPGPRRARAAEPGSRHHDDAGAVVSARRRGRATSQRPA
jgi:hypothetical protein